MLLKVLEHLRRYPAVALLGPRQVGKTTLARQIAQTRDAVYKDLENPADRGEVEDVDLFCADHRGRLVILDEIQQIPDIFAPIRSVIDRELPERRANGQFLFLGSASGDLLRQSGESLAGRIAYLEMTPLSAREVDDHDRLWLRGGFPDSYLAADDADSMDRRRQFITTYLERDIAQLDARIPAPVLHRLRAALAHRQGGLLNVSELSRILGISGQTVNRYLNLLEELMLLRRLPPWHGNVGKRLVKSSKAYIRDSGMTHALLGLQDMAALLNHPASGPSWEGFVIDNLHSVLPSGARSFFYRTSAGAEIDLILEMAAGDLWAIEIKRNSAPRLSKGFREACADLRIKRGFVVYPGDDARRTSQGVEITPLPVLMERITRLS